eukprot:GEMP01047292.1.p1 GENE.GEMP01047292.1~~GEMP01047292.1.p1  ORF type:complete len:195 (+),score=42.02 GEMP01047292.1:191-775(+)
MLHFEDSGFLQVAPSDYFVFHPRTVAYVQNHQGMPTVFLRDAGGTGPATFVEPVMAENAGLNQSPEEVIAAPAPLVPKLKKMNQEDASAATVRMNKLMKSLCPVQSGGENHSTEVANSLQEALSVINTMKVKINALQNGVSLVKTNLMNGTESGDVSASMMPMSLLAFLPSALPATAIGEQKKYQTGSLRGFKK